MSTRPELALPLPDEFVDAVARRVADLLAEEKPARPEPVAYTIASLAAEIGVSAKSIRGAIHRGELAAVRRGTHYLIAADAARAWATPSPSRSRHRRGRASARAGPGPLATALTPAHTRPLERTPTHG
ncbi:MAG: helix-turn-helix domain-containing protein [Solirubrobacteraceae bacterium]